MKFGSELSKVSPEMYHSKYLFNRLIFFEFFLQITQRHGAKIFKPWIRHQKTLHKTDQWEVNSF